MEISFRRRALICLLVCFGSGCVWAEAGTVYRVDVIVFAHLDGESDQRYSQEINDLSGYLDPESNARAAAWTAPQKLEELSDEEQARRDALATLDQLRALENPEQRVASEFNGGPEFPTPWLGLAAMTAQMASAWQRLEASARHRPLLWRSWHQPLIRSDRGRWIRLSGGEVLDLDWLSQEVADPQYLEDFEPGPYPFLLPRSKHQLDGIIRFRQRQFMHVDINLVWQLPVPAILSPLSSEWNEPGGFLLHPLQQSRSIRTDRIEYFDSSWLGVLIRVEAWKSPLAEESEGDIER